jgi:hypothetical protein
MTEYPNWFATTAIDNFATYLAGDIGRHSLRYLQLGAFTGDASVWLITNILTGGNSRLTDIDTWEGSDEIDHESMDFEDVYNSYLYKTSEYENDGKCYHYRTSTMKFLLSELSEKEYFHNKYDFIYIDADHTTAGVLLDAELSWLLLKSGGIMAFDDYTWGRHLPPSKTPRPGILLFTERHKDEIDTLVINDQYWIKKK